MAIDRKIQKIFGGNLSPSGNISVYGSKKAGSVSFSDNVETIQSNSWMVGIMGATSTDKAPYVQDLNALFYVITKQLAYLFQSGVPEWDSQTEYFSGKSLVLKESKLYIAIADSTNIEPEVTSGWEDYWQNFLSWSKIVGDIYNQTDLWNLLLNGVSYDNNVAQAIGGYPEGAKLYYTDNSNNVFIIQSLVDNNTNEPTASNIQFENSPEGTYYWKAISLRPTNETVVIKTWIDGANWYRLYSDGWIEQGGASTSNATVSLHIPMADTNYNVMVQMIRNVEFNEAVFAGQLTTTSFMTHCEHTTDVRWKVSGYRNLA